MTRQAPAPVRTSADDHWLTAVYYAIHTWTGKRPFWAGVFTLCAGVPIAYLPYADLRLGNISIAMATTGGAGALIIGVLLMTLGIALWFQQGIRVFAGVATILLGLVSLPVSNLGGFGVGLMLSLIGGSLALSWAPGTPPVEAAEPGAQPADAVPAPVPAGAYAPPATQPLPGAYAPPQGQPAPGPGYGVDPGANTSVLPPQRGTVPLEKHPWAPEGHRTTETTGHADGGRNSAG
ncbi:DUF6114 domain-containing protein [Streptomyces sp. BI20]|uniref:DUF6114 domain-containing protein n=1 Tax=Streptomyces sp. BI20 TaxID=3403460 RepID=UPI003C74A77A